jgi:outer membrane receptor protein involved in Fe transport
MKTLLSVLIGTLALAAVGAAADGTPERQVAIAIESTTLADALDKWAQQTGYQIIVKDWELAKALPAPTVKGRFAPRIALERLLQGSTLTYTWVSDQAVAIGSQARQSPTSALPPGDQHAESQLRVAQLNGSTGGLVVAAASQPAPSDTRTEQIDSSRALDRLEEIFVTGTHIHGAPNETVPLIVLDKQDIEAAGFGTTTQLIESLPQNFALANQSGVTVPGVSNSAVQGSGINLRGIGEGTTLVLINGRRLALGFFGSAVDVSALPLSAIERVDVLTDGASALYGSDAVGGVVNFILRRDFEGAETRLRTGWADGVDEYRVSQAFGHSWSSGNAMIAGEYYQRDLLHASDRDFVPATSDIGSLLPRDENLSIVASGRQELNEDVAVFADALFTQRDSFNESGAASINQNFTVDNPQSTGTLGFKWRMGESWTLEAAGSYAENKVELLSTSDFGRTSGISEFKTRLATAKIDGPIVTLPGGEVRMAFGADWRTESFEDTNTFLPDNIVFLSRKADQTVRSLFGEVNVPLIGRGNAIAGAERLDLSLAARYDDYSSFGSSIDPRVGFMWQIGAGVRVRGSYGTSYVAPRLVDYSLSGNGTVALTGPDPAGPGGLSRQLQIFGTDVDSLSAQESESSSFGVEFAPNADLRIALNYYRIRYDHRIADILFPVLENPASFGSLITRNPTPSQVESALAIGNLGRGFFDCDLGCIPDPAFDPSTIDVVVDFRRRNLSGLKTSGLDLAADYGWELKQGSVHVALAGTYIIELEQTLAAGTEPFDSVDTFNNPPDWRLRGSLGWQRGGLTTNLFVNHTDSYVDNRTGIDQPISAYTTVDARVAYAFGPRNASGALSGLTVALSAQNILDEDPPRTAVLTSFTDLGFDPTNASPLGRFVAVEIQKVW